MAFTVYKTSSDIIEAVKRNISLPTSQNTFSDLDILRFANEEMFISQVPSVLEYHEEYFVIPYRVSLRADISNYTIPNRAIGMRLRDLSWSDVSGNIMEMSRINADDKAYFQRSLGANNQIHKFYLEGNDVVLTPQVSGSQTGTLIMYMFIRPNQLVPNERAATIANFKNTITLTAVVATDTITIQDVIFTAVDSGATGNQFNIGGGTTTAATSLAAAINTNFSGEALASTNTIVLTTDTVLDSQNIAASTATIAGITWNTTTQVINFESLSTQATWLNPETSQTEDLFVAGEKIDFLQTNPGHKIYNFDIELPTISGNQVPFLIADVPETMVAGDYMCLANECIIPFLPPDFHTVLVEKTCSRILASLGDVQGLQVSQAKLSEMEKNQGILMVNRVEGSPQKVLARHSLLRFGKTSLRRRY